MTYYSVCAWKNWNTQERDMLRKIPNVSSTNACSRLCSQDWDCKFWTYHPSCCSNNCVLMRGKGSRVLHWNEAGFWNKLRFYLPDPRPALLTASAVRNKTASGPIGPMGLLVWIPLVEFI